MPVLYSVGIYLFINIRREPVLCLLIAVTSKNNRYNTGIRLKITLLILITHNYRTVASYIFQKYYFKLHLYQTLKQPILYHFK